MGSLLTGAALFSFILGLLAAFLLAKVRGIA